MRIRDRHNVLCDTGVDETLRVVGCTHAGGGGPADDFAPRADLFYEFADHVGWGTLRYAGDILEGWQFTRDQIEQQYPHLVSAYRMGVGVHGNHDKAISKHAATLRMGNVLLAHGHQADPFNSRYRLIGRVLTRIAKWLEWCGLDVDDPSWATPAALGGSDYTAYVSKYVEAWVQKVLLAEAPVALIYAHTHRAYISPLPGQRCIANAGCWASDHQPCSAVRIEPGRVTLLEIEP